MKAKVFFATKCLVSAWLVLVSIVPFFYLVALSFRDREGVLSLQQYYDVFLGTSAYLLRFWVTLLLCACIVAGQVFVTVLAGYAFAKLRFPGRRVVFFLLLVLMVLPLQVTLVPNYVVMDRLGLLDTYPSLMLPAIFAPLGTFILTQSFKSVPDSVIEAAKLDGANQWEIIWQIAAPANKSGLVSVALLSFLDAWSMVEQPVAYIKDYQRYPLAVALSYADAADPAVQLVCCLLVLLPPAFLFLYFHEELTEGIALAEVR